MGIFTNHSVYHFQFKDGELRPRKIPDVLKIAQGTAVKLRNEICAHRTQFSATAVRVTTHIPASLFPCSKTGNEEEGDRGGLERKV